MLAEDAKVGKRAAAYQLMQILSIVRFTMPMTDTSFDTLEP